MSYRYLIAARGILGITNARRRGDEYQSTFYAPSDTDFTQNWSEDPNRVIDHQVDRLKTLANYMDARDRQYREKNARLKKLSQLKIVGERHEMAERIINAEFKENDAFFVIALSA